MNVHEFNHENVCNRYDEILEWVRSPEEGDEVELSNLIVNYADAIRVDERLRMIATLSAGNISPMVTLVKHGT
jgi:hypothetical protein